MTHLPDYLTVAQVAAKVQLHESTIRHEIIEGRLPAVKFGSYRIDPDDVCRWLEARKVVRIEGVKPVPLRRGNSEETSFRQMARQMDSAGRESSPASVRHKKAS